MALITNDNQRAYLVKDKRREDYFASVNNIIKVNFITLRQVLNVENEPIIIIDYDYVNLKQANLIKAWLKSIDANDITESLTE